jgi:hypothetical protein
MSRDLPTGFAGETTADTFRPAVLVQLDWPGGSIYVWTGYGTISWDGHDFIGTGELGTISPVQESSDLRANGVVLELSGIPTALVTEALANDAQGQPGKVWIAALAANGTFAADPYLIFDGVIDTTPIRIGPETSTIAVQLEKELIDRRTKERRYTHEDQQIEYAGDMFFEYVAGLAVKEFSWGGKTQAAGGTTPASASSASSARTAANLV